jgi:dolichyl-phosphate-mannose-protein mannosyltransferase
VSRWAGGLALTATAATLFTTRHGPSVAPDSVTYVSAARNIVDGRGLTDFTGQRLTVFAPAYPALLSAGERVGIDAFSFARLINALVVGVIVLLAFVLLRRHVASTWLTVGATALVAFSSQLLIIAGYVSTDPLFFALTLGFIVVMEDLRAKPERRSALIVTAAALWSVAFLVRYAAFPLFVTGVIVIAVVSAKEGRVEILRRTISFVVLASIVPGLWILRNATSGTSGILGIRVRTGDTPLTLTRTLGEAAKDLVFSYRVPTAAAIVASLGGVLVVAPLAWQSRRELLPRLFRHSAAMLPIATFIVVGTVFVTVSHKVVGSDLNPRMLLPVWFPTIVLGAWLLDNLLTAGRRCGRFLLTRCVAVLMVALLGGSLVWFVQQVAKGTDSTYRYSSEPSTEIRRALAPLPPSARILSNNPWHVYLATDKQPVFLAPMKVRPSFSHRPISARAVTATLCTRPVFVLWFDSSPTTQHRSVRALAGEDQLALTRVRRVDGGTLYAIGRTNHSPACNSR